MPIVVRTDVREMSEEVFKETAYAVTGEAFEIHNQFGNQFGERVYKCELAKQCTQLGFARAIVEVPVDVTFGSFHKPYFLDLLINGGALFELKAEAGLSPAHRAQTLNYLFLTGLKRAKLFNFGSPRVQHEFVSTTLTIDERKKFKIDDGRFQAISKEGERFMQLFVTVLRDWGCFLNLSLYQEVITHFFGGKDRAIRAIPVIVDGRCLTTQPCHTLGPQTAFKLSGTDDMDVMEDALRRFLHHTQLTAIQWVNLHNHDVNFVTLLDPD